MTFPRRAPDGQIVPMTEAEIAALQVQSPPPVPHAVTMRQARLALLAAGKLADVDAAIDMLPEPMRSAAKIEWEYAATVERNSPLIAQLGPALGLDAESLDALFIAAEQL